jgi:hypothetical protein
VGAWNPLIPIGRTDLCMSVGISTMHRFLGSVKGVCCLRQKETYKGRHILCDLIEGDRQSFNQRLHFFREQIERVHVPNEMPETKIFIK